MPQPERIAIVGASLAGLRTAQALRGRGKYQGNLALIGGEPHYPYDRPPLSKQLLSGEWEPDRTLLDPPDTVDKLDLDLRLGTQAESLDLPARTIALSTGEHVGFDSLVIATGATPRRLPNTPDLEGIYTLRTIDDSMRIRAELGKNPKVAVVGGGFIGAEVAAVARSAGLEVTLIEALPAPLANAAGTEVGEACATLHRQHGVKVLCNALVSGFQGSGRVEGVLLADGSTVEADLVVVGIGVTPATSWLENSGLEIRDGVVCDSTLAAAPGIYAIGDVCRWYNPIFEEEIRVEHWTNVIHQSRLVARNLLAEPSEARTFASVPYVWSDQYDASIQSLGHPQPNDTVGLLHGSLESLAFVVGYQRKGIIVGGLTFNMPQLLASYRPLIEQRTPWETVLEHAHAME
ncbi:MAG: FAD-dependent oxidoreductase [Dehalococcoidia bacterium]|nr:FAD-dependent oxidoreductase [Dehalococcoidia bacterium]HCU99873.1 FAD-dependent oxidoreductase [Dehalococcoidia bacterium]|tara:strand:+ start:21 stop:1235 length:1215 start_codon:yes stop_codon:yes gene_type:complete